MVGRTKRFIEENMMRITLKIIFHLILLAFMASLESALGWPVLSYTIFLLYVSDNEKSQTIAENLVPVLGLGLILGVAFGISATLVNALLLSLAFLQWQSVGSEKAQYRSILMILTGTLATVLLSKMPLSGIDGVYAVVSSLISLLLVWRVYGAPLFFVKNKSLRIGGYG